MECSTTRAIGSHADGTIVDRARRVPAALETTASTATGSHPGGERWAVIERRYHRRGEQLPRSPPQVGTDLAPRLESGAGWLRQPGPIAHGSGHRSERARDRRHVNDRSCRISQPARDVSVSRAVIATADVAHCRSRSMAAPPMVPARSIGPAFARGRVPPDPVLPPGGRSSSRVLELVGRTASRLHHV